MASPDLDGSQSSPAGKRSEWKEFEGAVAKFLQSVSGASVVSENVYETDPDTGSRRQRDVVIEGMICGIKVSILVSCKRWSEPLSGDDIEHFFGEVASSPHHVGVIYSYSGFRQPAIDKARARKIKCCQIIEGEFPDLPASLPLWFLYFVSRIHISFPREDVEGLPEATLGELLGKTVDGQDLASILSARFQDLSLESARGISREQMYPLGMKQEVQIGLVPDTSETFDQRSLNLTLRLGWRVYRAKQDAVLVQGSYSFTDDSFTGRLAGPSIDTKSCYPGDGWEEIPYPPENEKNVISVVPQLGDVREAILEGFSDVPLSG